MEVKKAEFYKTGQQKFLTVMLTELSAVRIAAVLTQVGKFHEVEIYLAHLTGREFQSSYFIYTN